MLIIDIVGLDVHVHAPGAFGFGSMFRDIQKVMALQEVARA